jgi:DNA primase large subunit
VVHLLAHNRALPTQVLNPSPVFLQWYYDTHVKGREEEEEEEKQEAPSLMFRVDPLDLVPGVEYVSWRDLMPHWILNQMAMNNMQLAWRRTRKNKVNDYLRDWSRDLITKLWDVFCEQQRKLQRLQHHSSGPKFPLLTGKGVRFSIEHMVERLFPPCIRAAHNKQRFLRYNERLVVVAYMCNAGFTEDEIVYYFTHLNTLYPKKPNPMKLEVRFSMKSYLNEQRKKPNPQYCKNIWKNSTDPKRAQDPDRVRCPFVVSDIEDSLQAQEQCKNKCCDKMKFSGPHDLTLRWMQ